MNIDKNALDRYLTTPPEDDSFFESFNIDIFNEGMDDVYDPQTTPDDVYAEVEKEIETYLTQNNDDWRWIQKCYRKSLDGKGVQTTDTILAAKGYEAHLQAMRLHLRTVYPQLVERSQK